MTTTTTTPALASLASDLSPALAEAGENFIELFHLAGIDPAGWEATHYFSHAGEEHLKLLQGDWEIEIDEDSVLVYFGSAGIPAEPFPCGEECCGLDHQSYSHSPDEEDLLLLLEKIKYYI